MGKTEDQETNRKSGLAYAAGLNLFVSVIGFSGLGWLLDRWLETAPYCLAGGVVIGAAAGFYQFVRLTSKLS